VDERLIESYSSVPKAMVTIFQTVVAGDSWGTVFATGAVFGQGFMNYILKKNNCPYRGTVNIAQAGSTAKLWKSGSRLDQLTGLAPYHDILWLTLMGNDAWEELPACAKTGKTAEECGNEMVTNVLQYMGTILDAVHKANPEMKVVGFGYDIMFGDVGCSAITHLLFPQCWRNADELTGTRCFNKQFSKIQVVWAILAAQRPYVTAVNLLGTTQVAGGYPGVTIGKPDLDKFGPAIYWPVAEGCIHPGALPVYTSGAMIIMEAFYQQYWSSTLGC